MSTPAIPSGIVDPNIPFSAERSRTSHLISLSATHMHVRHADIPGIRIMPDPTKPSFRLSIIHALFPRSTRPFGNALRKYIPECPPALHACQRLTLAFFASPQDRLSRLITDQANATPARLSSTPSPPRPETRAFASVPHKP